MSDSSLHTAPLELAEMPSAETIIKVVGVGGGGSNAVNYIYNKDIEGVSCVAINTDAKSLALLNLPHKLPIARHGSGANPAVSKQAAEEHEEDIRSAIKGAEMVFITAGMGKGTGTGASPVVAKIAQELGILTVGVVTIPFKFEGKQFVHRAIDGLEQLRQHVDSLLIIANEQIKSVYGNLKCSQAFGRADDIIATAISGITGAVTSTQGVCTDMEDMRTTLKGGQNVMMGVGIADGPDRAILAIRNALESPLLVNNSIKGGNRIIINYAMSPEYEMTIEEMEIINDELKNQIGYYGDQIWGTLFDESLGSKLKVTIVVTGIKSITNEELEAMTLGNQTLPPAQPTATRLEEQKTVETTSPLSPFSIMANAPTTPTPTAPAAATESVNTASQQVVTTLTEEQPKQRTVSLTDFDDDNYLTKIEDEAPNWSCTTGLNRNTAYVSNDPNNPIVHNDFLDNNVD